MILVVEDHQETRWLILRLLERGGHKAIGVADGAAALQFLREQPPPTLIVLDHGLPHVDGLTVLRTLRQDARHRVTPVILYTASPLPSIAEAALRAGAAEVVTKGGDWDVLLAAVQRHAVPAVASPHPVAGGEPAPPPIAAPEHVP
jgi:CheY-like chemotaxis protein